jgi:hypothetical protein
MTPYQKEEIVISSVLKFYLEATKYSDPRNTLNQSDFPTDVDLPYKAERAGEWSLSLKDEMEGYLNSEPAESVKTLADFYKEREARIIQMDKSARGLKEIKIELRKEFKKWGYNYAPYLETTYPEAF